MTDPKRPDNPNQEHVRGDQSGPADEGQGGSERVDPEPVDAPPQPDQPETRPQSGQVGPQSQTPDQPDESGQPEQPVGPQAGDPLDDMTKDELIEEASQRGVDVSTAMNKDEIKAAIRAG